MSAQEVALERIVGDGAAKARWLEAARIVRAEIASESCDRANAI